MPDLVPDPDGEGDFVPDLDPLRVRDGVPVGGGLAPKEALAVSEDVVVGLVVGDLVALRVVDVVVVGSAAVSTTIVTENTRGCSGGRPGSLGITRALPSVASLLHTDQEAPGVPAEPHVPRDTSTTSPVEEGNPMPAAVVGASTM